MGRALGGDGKHRELRGQLFGVALRANGLLVAKHQGFKPVIARFANVFENRHIRTPSSVTTVIFI